MLAVLQDYKNIFWIVGLLPKPMLQDLVEELETKTDKKDKLLNDKSKKNLNAGSIIAIYFKSLNKL